MQRRDGGKGLQLLGALFLMALIWGIASMALLIKAWSIL